MPKPIFYHWIDHHTAAKHQHAEIAKLTGLGQGRILEIGCDDAAYLGYFQDHGWECLGITDDQAKSDQAFQQHDILTLIGHITEVNVPRSSYDLIRIRGDLSEDEQADAMLQVAYEAAAPTGYLIAEVWNKSGWPVCPMRYIPVNMYSRKKLIQEVTDAGFEIGGMIAPELGDSVWSPLNKKADHLPFFIKLCIDKILGFFDRGSLLVIFGQKAP